MRKRRLIPYLRVPGNIPWSPTHEILLFTTLYDEKSLPNTLLRFPIRQCLLWAFFSSSNVTLSDFLHV